jgi:hypothetical protein
MRIYCNALDQPLPLGRGAGRRWSRTKARRIGRYGCIASVSAAGDMPGQPRIPGLHGGIDYARRLGIGVFGDELGKADVDARNVEDARRAERTSPVDDPRTILRHDHVAGWRSARL